jgi:hypothetical protein
MFTYTVTKVKLCYCLQGDTVEYYPYVPRRYNSEGPGGLQGSIGSSRVATINMFYTFDRATANQATYVELTNHQDEGKVGSLRMIPSIHRDAVRAAGFDTESLVDTVIVHVDTIAHKLKLLPHFTDDSKLIVIRTHVTR